MVKRYIKRILSTISPTLETKLAYKKSFGKKLDLKNPQTINEKILWLKLNNYNNNEIITKCADKYRLREYLKEKNMEFLLPKMYGNYDNADEIEWTKLPDSFVIKCNHGCGYNIIVKNKNDFNFEDVKKQLNEWMKTDYWKEGGEIQYKYIKKKIVIEEFLKDVEDYKFYCFNGLPKIMYVSTSEWENNIFMKDKYLDFFDMNFNRIECQLKGHPNYSGNLEYIKNFEKMKELAQKLSEDFPFVRVDLYDSNGKIYISELTFIPTAGFMHLTPKKLELEWGKMLNISNLNK